MRNDIFAPWYPFVGAVLLIKPYCPFPPDPPFVALDIALGVELGVTLGVAVGVVPPNPPLTKSSDNLPPAAVNKSSVYSIISPGFKSTGTIEVVPPFPLAFSV